MTAGRAYDTMSDAPSDIHCVTCNRAIPEKVVAGWLWRFNGMPPIPTCSIACARAYEAQEE